MSVWSAEVCSSHLGTATTLRLASSSMIRITVPSMPARTADGGYLVGCLFFDEISTLALMFCGGAGGAGGAGGGAGVSIGEGSSNTTGGGSGGGGIVIGRAHV